MPGLTRNAKILARSEGCPRQIVEWGDLVYGFQCHMEFTREVVRLPIAASEGEFATPPSNRFVQRPETHLANDYDEMNRHLVLFLDKLVADYATARS